MQINDSIFLGSALPEMPDDTLVIQQNKRLLFLSLLGNLIEIIVRGTSPLSLPNAIANSLEYLKAFGGTKQRNLPDNYIQRQFIYMMGGSYLLTDIMPTYDGHYEMDFQTTTVSSNAAAYLGGRAGQSPAGLIFSHGSNNILVTDAFGQRYTLAHVVENNTRYKYVFNNKVFTLYKNGEVVETHTFTSSTASGAALAIKAINMGDSIDFAGEGIYLYGFKAWNAQGELIADYVPAVQKGTVPVVGFYDTVSGTFKTATAGTFAAGGEAVPTPDTPMDIVSNNGALKARHQSGLPLGYTLLEYIESTGTQYVDIGIAPKTTLSAKIKYNVLQLTEQSNIAIFGSISNQTGLFSGVAGNPSVYYVNSGASSSPDIPFALNTIREEEYINDTMIRDSVTYTTNPIVANNNSMALFGRNTDNGVQRIGTLRIYYFALYDNGVLVRNLIPAKNSSNVVGMYDLVSGQFFTNAGTGTFTAGSPVNDLEVYADSASKNLFDYRYFYDNYQMYTGSTVGRCPIKLKPNTTYTISTNRNSSENNSVVFAVSGSAIDWTPNTVNNGVLTNSPRTVTTDSNGYLCLGIYVQGERAIPESDFESGTVWVQIEEGSVATPYVPYWNTTETIWAHGKNLFNENSTFSVGQYDNGVWRVQNDRLTTDYIMISPNTNYTVSVDLTNALNLGLVNYNYFDKDKTWLGNRSTNGDSSFGDQKTKTFNISNADTRYVKITIRKNNNTDISALTPTQAKIQLERGSTATAYRPYYDGGTAKAEMLLKVGDYEDVQEILSGAVTRNVGVKVLDGVERVRETATPGVVTLGTNIGHAQNITNAYCSHMSVLPYSVSTANMTNDSIKWSASGQTLYAKFAFSSDPTTIQNWLADQYNAGTPVIIVYPLATPATESVAGQTMQVQQGDNFVEITQAAIDNLELEAKYQAAVTLTIQEVQDANLDPNVQVTIN